MEKEKKLEKEIMENIYVEDVTLSYNTTIDEMLIVLEHWDDYVKFLNDFKELLKTQYRVDEFSKLSRMPRNTILYIFWLIRGLFVYCHQSCYNKFITLMLNVISHNKKVVGFNELKRFYKDNKDVINNINKKSNIICFIHDNFNIERNTVDVDEDTMLKGLCLFINYFDGFNDAREILLETLKEAKESGYENVLYSLNPHHKHNPLSSNNLHIY